MEYGNPFENRCLIRTVSMRPIVFSFLILIVPSFNAAAQVLNKGVGGNNTKQLLLRIDSDVITEDPDLVIVMAGTNDLLNSRKMISYVDYEDNLNLILRKIKSMGSQVLLMSPPPVDSTYLLRGMTNHCISSRQMKLWIQPVIL